MSWPDAFATVGVVAGFAFMIWCVVRYDAPSAQPPPTRTKTTRTTKNQEKR